MITGKGISSLYRSELLESRRLLSTQSLVSVTYLGGADDDRGLGIAADFLGNIWVTGPTKSAGWVSGGFDPTHNGGDDLFVAKLSPSGSPLWSSFLGGSGTDWPTDIAIDAAGNAWITGYTTSTNWATGGFDTILDGSEDAFIAKVHSNGTLAWVTLLGGSSTDRGLGVEIDAAGSAWVTGTTNSSGWTVGGFDTSYNGNTDGFIAKINANGSFAWSSYMGGTAYDAPWDVVVSPAGAFISGQTLSSAWTSGGFDSTYGGGGDAFLAKIDASGALAWSSYLGGTNEDIGTSTYVDSLGHVWISGQTASSGWTTGGFDVSHNGAYDAFVAKATTGGTLLWSSYLGGGSDDGADNIAIDSNNNAWIAGYTRSNGWAVGGFDSTHNGETDAFVTKIDDSGSVVQSSYLGGANYEYGGPIVVDSSDGVWVTGRTTTPGWVVGGFDTTFNGIVDAFVAKIVDVPAVPPPAEILARGVAYSNQWFQSSNFISYPDLPSNTYKVERVFNDGNGFYALGLTSSTYGPALVFRGTEDILDWWDNANWKGIGFDQFSRNWSAVSSWLNSTAMTGPVDFIGHSLGGALVQWFASKWTQSANPPAGQTKLLDEVITFNSPGISGSAANAFNSTEANSVTHYIVNGDVVSMAGTAYIAGQVKMAEFSDLSILDFDKHLLPLTVDSVTVPADDGWVLRQRRPDLAFDPTPPTVAQLSSPLYGHDDPDYKLWISGMQLAGYLVNVTTGVPLHYLGGALKYRGTTEAARVTLGIPFSAVMEAARLALDTANTVKATFSNLGARLRNSLEVILDRGITVSTSTSTPATLEISGGMSIGVRDSLTINLPSTLGGAIQVNDLVKLTSLDTTGTINSAGLFVDGSFSVLGGMLSVNGNAKFDWSRTELEVNGAINILNGFVTTNGMMRVGQDSGLTLGGGATVRIPDGVMFGGKTLGSGAFLLQFSPDGNLSNDFIAGWGTAPWGQSIGVRFYFDSPLHWDFLNAREIAALAPLAGPPLSPSQGFAVPPGTGWVMFSAEWENNSSNVAIELVTPSGAVLDEAAILADPTMEIVTDLTTPRRRVVNVNNPAAGTWQIRIVDDTGLGSATLNALTNVGIAPFASNLTATGGSRRETVTITASIANPSASTQVSLFYDADGSGADGVLIAEGLPVSGGQVEYDWLPTTAPTGAAYVYAVVTDANQTPQVTYAASAVAITEIAPDATSAEFDPDKGNSVRIQFNQDVAATLSTADIELRDLTANVTIPIGQLQITPDPYTNAAYLTINGTSNGGIPGVLPDGRYELRIIGAGIANATGESMTADKLFSFNFLNGDANRDGRVNTVDFNILAGNFGGDGRVFSQGNFSYDANGDVDSLDFNIFVAQYGKSLPAASSSSAFLVASAAPIAVSPLFADTTDETEPVSRLDLLN